MSKNTGTRLFGSFIFIILSACSSDQGNQGQATVDNQQTPVVNSGPGEMAMEMSMDNMQGMAGMTSNETMPDADDLAQPRPTDNNIYQLTIEPDVDPLPLNQMHGWVLSIQDGTGAPVDNAEVVVEGGMPAHNHGMPTSPQVTANLGGGRYQIEGVQFQMPGHWVVTFNITVDDQSDSATYNLMLKP